MNGGEELRGAIAAERLAGILSRLQAASPGPWKINRTPFVDRHNNSRHENFISTAWDHPQLQRPAPVLTLSHGMNAEGGRETHLYLSHEDAEFMAQAWQDVLDLLSEVRRLQALVDAPP